MKKILIFLLFSMSAFAQRNGLIDADTTTRPKAGISALAFNSGNLKIIRNSGNSYGVVTTNNTYANPSWISSIALAKVTGLQSALDAKVNVVSGKGLSTEDYTTTEKSKLAGIASGATANSTDAQLRDRSTHTGTQAHTTITGLGTASTLNVAASGNAASGEVVKGNDTRLSDARTPTTHTHSQSDVTGLVGGLAAKANKKSKTVRRVVLLGDSFSDICGGKRLDGTEQNYFPNGYWTWANIFARQAFDLVMNAGVSGDNLQGMDARFAADVTPYNPDLIVFMGGFNNIGGINSGNYEASITSAKAAIISIVNKAYLIDSYIIVTGIPPRSQYPTVLTTAQKDAVSELNQFFIDVSHKYPNCIYSSFAHAYQDPNTFSEIFYDNGGEIAYTVDGVHPTASGSVKMGYALSKTLEKLAAHGDLLFHGKGTKNLVTNPTFSGATGSTLPTSWTGGAIVGTPATYTLTSRTDEIPGNWLQISGVNGIHILDQSYVGGTLGDSLVFSFEYEFTPISGGTNGILACASIENRLGAPTFSSFETVFGNGRTNLNGGGADAFMDDRLDARSGVVRTPPIAWKSNTNFMQLVIRLNGKGTWKIARPTVRKIN